MCANSSRVEVPLFRWRAGWLALLKYNTLDYVAEHTKTSKESFLASLNLEIGPECRVTATEFLAAFAKGQDHLRQLQKRVKRESDRAKRDEIRGDLLAQRSAVASRRLRPGKARS
jgi:hypothetical protein